jgi:menaquinone-dependent protoporphyrinogen IX oxidase
MKRVLIAYATNAGSTEEVAQAVADVLKPQALVEVKPLGEVRSVSDYDAVIVGAPMILGWHRSAVQFVKRHQQALAGKPVAYFCTLMSLTQPAEGDARPAPLFIDPELPKAPHTPGRMTIKERYATVANYLRPVLKAAPSVHPLSVAFLGGKLELFRLKWWQMLFVMVIIQAPPGDRRNWPCISEWAERIRPALLA